MGDNAVQSPAWNTLGWVHEELCNWDRGIEFNQKGLDLALTLGDPEITINAQINLADYAFATGERERARRELEALRELSAGPGEAAAQAPHPDPRPTPVPALSKRELQVLQLLASALDTRQIAENLGISPITTRNHITPVVSKLGARNRLEAVLYASRRRLI